MRGCPSGSVASAIIALRVGAIKSEALHLVSDTEMSTEGLSALTCTNIIVIIVLY